MISTIALTAFRLKFLSPVLLIKITSAQLFTSQPSFMLVKYENNGAEMKISIAHLHKYSGFIIAIIPFMQHFLWHSHNTITTSAAMRHTLTLPLSLSLSLPPTPTYALSLSPSHRVDKHPFDIFLNSFLDGSCLLHGCTSTRCGNKM